MHLTSLGDVGGIVLGVARRPTAYAASTGRAAACLVGFGGGIFAESFIFPFFQIIRNQIARAAIKIFIASETHAIPIIVSILTGSAMPSFTRKRKTNIGN